MKSRIRYYHPDNFFFFVSVQLTGFVLNNTQPKQTFPITFFLLDRKALFVCGYACACLEETCSSHSARVLPP